MELIELLSLISYITVNPQTGELNDQLMLYGFPYADADWGYIEKRDFGIMYSSLNRNYNTV